MMEWGEDLRKFRESIEAIRQQPTEPREIGEEELEQRLRIIQEAFEDLRPETYLEEMNRVLLDGRGEVEVYLPWEDEGDEDEDDEDEDDGENEVDEEDDDEDEDDEDSDDDDEDEEEEELEAQDVASAILVWDAGECELAIDVGLEGDRVYWQVNGDDVPTNDVSLREALKKAFAEEVGL